MKIMNHCFTESSFSESMIYDKEKSNTSPIVPVSIVSKGPAAKIQNVAEGLFSWLGFGRPHPVEP
jgi:hypothetical protein